MPKGSLERYELLLRRAFDDGRREWGELSLSFEDFAAEHLSRVRQRLESIDEPTDPSTLHKTLARSCGVDFYLALACEQGCSSAWRAFEARLAPRLEGLARKRGADLGTAREIVEDLPSDLLATTSSLGGAPRISQYNATGSLFAWLAVFVARRIADRARVRRVESLDELHPLRWSSGTPDASTQSSDDDPAQRAIVLEAVAALRRMIGAAWSTLDDRHQLALVLKYRDGVAQKEIARVLRVGEPRVSRILGTAQGRLREAAAMCARELDTDALAQQPTFWRLMAGELAESLQVSSDVDDPPERDES